MEISATPFIQPTTTNEGKPTAPSTPTEQKKLDRTPNNDEAQQASDEKLVQELTKRDREVRTHEAAHLSAAGQYAQGGPTYSFQRGPNGKQFAIGGEVNIDTSPIPGDPQATIQKAQTIRRAALAPSDPSSQDRSVAASATQLELKARTEQLEAQKTENAEKDQDDNPTEEQTITPDNQNAINQFEQGQSKQPNLLDAFA